jgi:hypothetical protein
MDYETHMTLGISVYFCYSEGGKKNIQYFDTRQSLNLRLSRYPIWIRERPRATEDSVQVLPTPQS